MGSFFGTRTLTKDKILAWTADDDQHEGQNLDPIPFSVMSRTWHAVRMQELAYYRMHENFLPMEQDVPGEDPIQCDCQRSRQFYGLAGSTESNHNHAHREIKSPEILKGLHTAIEDHFPVLLLRLSMSDTYTDLQTGPRWRQRQPSQHCDRKDRRRRECSRIRQNSDQVNLV